MAPGRTILCGVLFLALMAQTFYQPSIMLSYYLNTAAYASKCINKARPMLHCNGQCLLMKKIREAEKQDKNLPEHKFSKSEVLYSGSAFASLPAVQVHRIAKKYPPVKIWVPVKRPASIFHPPSAC